MLLTILFIILFLAGITFILLKWKGTVSLIPLGICLTGIILVLYLNTGEKRKAQAEKKLLELNLIEYTEYITKINKTLEITDAVATANVNMRDEAGREGGIIKSVPNGAQVSIISSDNKNGWFHAFYEGSSGWIYGRYLKNAIILSKKQTTTVHRSGKRFFLYIIPESSGWGKLLGLLIGISITLYLALMGYCDILSAKRFGISWAYFVIKNFYIFIGSYPDLINLGSLLTMLFTSALLAFVLNALVNISLNLIDQYRIKTVSH